jgi:AcrR family transcriptional regulator
VTPSEQPRRRGRPTAPLLSQEKITRAAVELIELRGYTALTMAALARQLGVAPSALYNHVNNKRQLLLWIQDHVNQEIDCSDFAVRPWDAALESWAHSYRDAYARHSLLVPVIAVTPVAGSPATVAMYEQVATGLRAGGWPDDQVMDVVVAIESFVLGSALDAAAPDDIFDVPAGQAPVLAEVVGARVGRDAARAAFDLGLATVLAGLRERLRALVG